MQCQIDIFKWLIKYIDPKENQPILDCKNVSSVLVSADSLIMKDLVDECLMFIKTNLSDIVKLNENVPPYKSHIAKQLAKMISIEELNSLEDRKNYLLSRLYKKKLEIFFEESENLLVRCLTCKEMFTKTQADLIPCSSSDNIFINYRGEVVPQHNLDLSFDLNEFVMVLREK